MADNRAFLNCERRRAFSIAARVATVQIILITIATKIQAQEEDHEASPEELLGMLLLQSYSNSGILPGLGPAPRLLRGLHFPSTQSLIHRLSTLRLTPFLFVLYRSL
jgi:hypothetical protein